MRYYKAIIEYDGYGYSGWQYQDDCQTIEGEINKAIYHYCQESPKIQASGRTDAGVHAYGQVINFALKKEPKNLYEVASAINFHLDKNAIKIIDIEEVDESFNARFDAAQRQYIYKILNRKFPSPIDINRKWHVAQKLDIKLMQQGAKHLIGTHNFNSFRTAKCQAKNPIRSIDEINISRNNDDVIIEVKALSFLHHMIRNITGVLVDIGLQKITPDHMIDIINAENRCAAGVTAPAHGLYFNKVIY